MQTTNKKLCDKFLLQLGGGNMRIKQKIFYEQVTTNYLYLFLFIFSFPLLVFFTSGFSCSNNQEPTVLGSCYVDCGSHVYSQGSHTSGSCYRRGSQYKEIPGCRNAQIKWCPNTGSECEIWGRIR
jgi:hypothetical protein